MTLHALVATLLLAVCSTAFAQAGYPNRPHETRQAMADRVCDNPQSFFASGALISAAPTA